MSASGRMAKKTELKRKWEDRLKNYREPILYLRSILTWKRPIDFGVLVVLVTLSLWLYFSIETTVVTLASLFVVAWTLVSGLFSVAAVKIPWHLVVAQEQASNVDYFGDVIGFFVQVRFALADTVEDMQRFKAANPTRFVLQITVSGLLLAYLGSFVSGQFLIIALIYALLLLPGAVANGVPERIAAVTEPHIKVYREKITALLSKLMQQVDQQIKKAKGAPAQPQQTTVAATGSTSTAHVAVTATTTTATATTDSPAVPVATAVVTESTATESTTPQEVKEEQAKKDD